MRLNSLIRLFAAVLSLAASIGAVQAADPSLQAVDSGSQAVFGQFGRYADQMEIRLGGLAYDRGFFSSDEFDGVVVNGEFLFRSPDFLGGIGAPRPYVGFDAAIADDPIHFIYSGLSWDMSLTQRTYLSGSVGGAITTAENLKDPAGYKALGSRVLFHLGAALGFDVTDKVTVQLYADHFSNADLAEPNNGAEAMGARIGFRF